MMNYLEKVRFLKERNDYYFSIRDLSLDQDEITVNINPKKAQWEAGEIEQIQSDYPFLPQSYIDFIKEFDSLGLAWVVFYGSRKAKVIPLEEELDYWKDKMKDQYFPFGKDADGSIYALNRKGEVVWFDRYDYEWEKPPLFIASSFESFINDCLLGKRFPEFMGRDTDKFYKFLQEQGWA